MKKSLMLGATLLMGLSLAACGNNDDTSSKSSSSESSSKAIKVSKKATPKYYFKDNVAESRDVKIEIVQQKVIPVGEVGNEYGEKPVIAFWYKTTNKTDKDIDPTSAWIALFTAVQDNNENSVNELDVAGLPDEQFLDSQTENIKKDGTVENAVAYDLDDETTPVTLSASKGVGGAKLGEQTYDIK